MTSWRDRRRELGDLFRSAVFRGAPPRATTRVDALDLLFNIVAWQPFRSERCVILEKTERHELFRDPNYVPYGTILYTRG